MSLSLNISNKINIIIGVLRVIKEAVIDENGLYRYILTRIWDKQKPHATFIMLNPSTADASIDDPTIRRCINFSRAWGFGGIKVVNVFAFRATDPKKLMGVEDPIGQDNHSHVVNSFKMAGIIVAAWGASGPQREFPYNRIKMAMQEAGIQKIYCLGITKDGNPRHPLYIKNSTKPIPYII